MEYFQTSLAIELASPGRPGAFSIHLLFQLLSSSVVPCRLKLNVISSSAIRIVVEHLNICGGTVINHM
eukprot:478554-Hanusia_phi.AAC.1